jgi:spermidine synthase
MSSDTTLILERRPGSLRLYLGGDLQFDTDDEVIYHERLAHPALLAARARFGGPLRLLVLGGGDGLLVRELLRHEGVASVRLIDYNPEVLALAGAELTPWNGSSLADNRVVVEVADVREALASAGLFHAIFSDLTCPGTLADCGLFTREWFCKLHTHLEPGGVLALNGLSPNQTPAAYWCLYQTLRSAGLAALPGQSRVPSFAQLGYGDWGFFLGSDRAITPEEVRSAPIPQGVRTLDGPGLMDCFTFPRQQADARSAIRPSSDPGRTLYEYLLDATAIEPGEAGETVCFLGFDDPFPPIEPAVATVPSLRLKGWLDRQPGTGIDDLLMCVPLGHRIVTRELVMEWSGHLIQVTRNLDLRRLISALLRRAADLPGRIVAELRRYRTFLSRGEDPAANFATWGWRFFSVLMLVIVLAQTAMPTSVYAKGGVGHSGHSPVHGSYFGGMAYPPGRTFSFPVHGYPMLRPAAPFVHRGGGYVSGGAGITTTPYYYWYSDPRNDYYYCVYNGRYYYYSRPR